MILAKRLLNMFPMLINDIYTCDRYFGESSLVCRKPLDVVITFENDKWSLIESQTKAYGHRLRECAYSKTATRLRSRCSWAMSGHLLSAGWSKRLGQLEHQTCFPWYETKGYGTRGRAQSASSDGPEIKSSWILWNRLSWVGTLPISTLTDGPRMLICSNICCDHLSKSYAYWGEYPLSFAACLGSQDCYKLLLAKGANPNKQDSNGNSTLHMTVIANRKVIRLFPIWYWEMIASKLIPLTITYATEGYVRSLLCKWCQYQSPQQAKFESVNPCC